jgi:sulfide:quinone oxidoreductase
MDKIVYITPTFAVTGQLAAEDFAAAAALGFTAIVNNRPDGEEDGQLTSLAAAAHAQLAGLAYHHNPAGKLDLFSDRVVDSAASVLSINEGPILAYCKSGMRCSIIWAAAAARNQPVDDILFTLTTAGFDFDFLRDDLLEQASRSAATTAPADLVAA